MPSPLHRLKRAVKLAFYVFRSAVTGQYVTEEYAEKHPKSTVRERRNKSV